MKQAFCKGCTKQFISNYNNVYCDSCRIHGVPLRCADCGDVFFLSKDKHMKREENINAIGRRPRDLCPKCAKRYGNCVDETGSTFGCLHVIRLHKVKSGMAYWLCQCECGDVRPYNASMLRQLGNHRTCTHHTPIAQRHRYGSLA